MNTLAADGVPWLRMLSVTWLLVAGVVPVGNGGLVDGFGPGGEGTGGGGAGIAAGSARGDRPGLAGRGC